MSCTEHFLCRFMYLSMIFLQNLVRTSKFTVGPVLEGVLAFEELACGVVALADPTGINKGLRAQNPVTAHSLNTQKWCSVL